MNIPSVTSQEHIQSSEQAAICRFRASLVNFYIALAENWDLLGQCCKLAAGSAGTQLCSQPSGQQWDRHRQRQWQPQRAPIAAGEQLFQLFIKLCLGSRLLRVKILSFGAQKCNP
jgi:hypothetical protein